MSTATDKLAAPKLFISYSWTSADHKSWVLNLAAGLRENGVDVLLDRWHLLEGQDTHVFMEQMVNDPEINHVALICDRKYVQKADLRDGGVGVEAQIITPSIYASHQQTKFVAVVTELDASGKPYVPIYYGAKKWLPFVEAENYSSDFDTLLRWIFDKPLDTPPPLGKPPAFLSEDDRVVKLATSSLQRRAVEALKGSKPNASAALIEYYERVVNEIEKLRIRFDDSEVPFDEKMVQSIEAFLPYRNEIVTTFITAAIYANEQETWQIVHRFFERLLPFQDRPGNFNSWNPNEFDNFKFIVSELFLYLIATNARYEKFDAVTYFLEERYFSLSKSSSDERLKSFVVFWSHSSVLAHRQQRLKLRYWSLQSVLLKERNGGQPISFDYIIFADVLLYMRSRIGEDTLGSWFPITFVYLDRYQPTMEIFARAQSAKYFKRIQMMLGVKDLATLKARVTALDREQGRPTANFNTLEIGRIIEIEKIASVP